MIIVRIINDKMFLKLYTLVYLNIIATYLVTRSLLNYQYEYLFKNKFTEH